MRPHCDQFPLIHHRNPVSVLHRGQPVGDHQGRAALHQRRQCLLNQMLALRIQCAGGFVEQQHRRVGQQRAGNGQALTLPARKPHTAVAQMGLIALRE